MSTRSEIRTNSSRERTSTPRRCASPPFGSSARNTSARASAVETNGRRRRRYARRSPDSGSRATSFTIAEESRYVGRSALVGTQSFQHARGRFFAGRERERFGQVVEVAGCRLHFSCRSQLLEPVDIGERREECDGPPSVGDLERLPGLDAAQELTRALAELA